MEKPTQTLPKSQESADGNSPPHISAADGKKPRKPPGKPRPNFIELLSLLLGAAGTVIGILAYLNSIDYIRPRIIHDVAGRVLNVVFYTRGMSKLDTNGLFFVDLALINRGNQNEIIRHAKLSFADDKDFRTNHIRSIEEEKMDFVLTPGEKRVLRLNADRGIAFSGKRMWLGVTVRSIAPTAEDLDCHWPICTIELANDGNGGSYSFDRDTTPLVEIISNTRQPHQKAVGTGW